MMLTISTDSSLGRYSTSISPIGAVGDHVRQRRLDREAHSARFLARERDVVTVEVALGREVRGRRPDPGDARRQRARRDELVAWYSASVQGRHMRSF